MVVPLVVMGFSFGLFAIAIPAIAQSHGSIAASGFLAAAISAGGVVGGIALGARPSVATYGRTASARGG